MHSENSRPWVRITATDHVSLNADKESSFGHKRSSIMNLLGRLAAEDYGYENSLYRLDYFEEAVGVLHEVEDFEGLLLAKIGRVTLLLPEYMADVLRQHLGDRIGILRTDDTERSYRIRILSDG